MNGVGSQPTTLVAGGGQPTSSAAPAPTASAPSERSASSAPAAGEKIVYEVTGKGRATDITFSSNGSDGAFQQDNARLPFRKVVKAGELVGTWTLTARNGRNSGEISCRITKNGEVIAEDIVAGPYAAVTCPGS